MLCKTWAHCESSNVRAQTKRLFGVVSVVARFLALMPLRGPDLTATVGGTRSSQPRSAQSGSAISLAFPWLAQ